LLAHSLLARCSLLPSQEWASDGEDDDAPPGSAAAFWADAHVVAEDPTLPWTLSPALTIERLGRIEYIRPAYHAPRALYPIGYAATRRAPPEAGGRLWRCEIVDGGDAPIFRVSVVMSASASAAAAARAAAAVFEGPHPTIAWYAAMAAEAGGGAAAAAPLASASGAASKKGDGKRAAVDDAAAAAAATAAAASAAAAAAAAGNKRGAPSGAEMFGLTQKRVTAALQRLPDAPRCDKYQARGCSARAAALAVAFWRRPARRVCRGCAARARALPCHTRLARVAGHVACC
jgi:hypothetical protein